MIPSILLYIIPILILAVGGVIVMLADAFQEREGGLALPTALLHFAAGAAALALWKLAGHSNDAAQVLQGYLAFDRQALFLDIVIALGGLLASLLAGGYMHEHGLERGEFYTLLTFSSAGCMMLAGANDLLMVFIGLETLSLGVYAMTGFRRTSPRSVEGAVKYFLLSSFAAALMLYGLALLYGITGHTDLASIREALSAPVEMPPGVTVNQTEVRDRIALIAMVLVIVGLAFKVSAVPFHMWTPDAYEGAPTPATTYMSVAVKASAFGAMLRVLLTLFGDPNGAGSGVGGWPAIMAWLAVLTMFVGNLTAMAQSSIKRMLAYSSIAHAGYIMVALVVSPRSDTLPGTTMTIGDSGVSAVLFYLLGYTVSNVGAFGSLILAGHKGAEAVSYDDLAGFGKRSPAAALSMTFFLLSLIGVPPTVGFFAKFYVIRAALDAGYVWLAIFVIINSAIGAYYYLRVMVKMYMQEPAPGAPRAVPMSSGYVSVALIAAAILTLWFGLNPSHYLELAREAVRVVATS